MSRTLWVIAEDANDVAVLRQIIHKKGFQIQVKAYPGNNTTSGITQLANNLEKWIDDLRNLKLRSNDCIAVLHDQDDHVPDHKTVIQRIAQICRQKDVIHLVADNTIEAWLLADEALCHFLEIAIQGWDGRTDAKRQIESLLRKRKMTYQARDRDELINHLNGTADQFSPSLRLSIAALQSANCL